MAGATAEWAVDGTNSLLNSERSSYSKMFRRMQGMEYLSAPLRRQNPLRNSQNSWGFAATLIFAD
jgi:hypothetical protein